MNPVAGSVVSNGSQHMEERPPVVDLRESSESWPAPDVEPPTPPEAAGPPPTSRRRRFLIICGAVGLVVLFLLDGVIGQVTHDAHQRHLAFELTEPAEHVRAGEALMNLQIPSIEVNEIVVEGASSSELRGGLGRVTGTADIGSKGNTVVLGRRTRFGRPFARLAELEEGATVAVKTRNTEVRLYSVESVERHAETDRAPLDTTDEERLTLVTSTGGYFPERRVVVVAVPKEGSVPSDAARESGERVPSSALDQRPTSVPGGLVVWACLAAIVLVLLAVGRSLSRRYTPAIVVVALAPIAALLLVVLMYSADVALPATV